MKPSPSMLVPLFRSDTQGRLLAAILRDPFREAPVGELAETAGTSFPTATREVDRLVLSGFLRERRYKRMRLIRANTEHALFRPVREIVEYAYGPVTVLPALLAPLKGVEEAFVYGSWAARSSGIGGPDPGDIDVLVIGAPDRSALFAAAEEAEKTLRREVSVRPIRRDIWESATPEPFVQALRSRPLTRLELRPFRETMLS